MRMRVLYFSLLGILALGLAAACKDEANQPAYPQQQYPQYPPQPYPPQQQPAQYPDQAAAPPQATLPPPFPSGIPIPTQLPIPSQIMLWGYEHSPEKPAPWPAEIPPPVRPSPPRSGVLKHVVDGALLPDLERFIGSLRPRQAVSLAGHKWSIGRRVLLPADAHISHARAETWRAYVEAVRRKNPHQPAESR